MNIFVFFGSYCDFSWFFWVQKDAQRNLATNDVHESPWSPVIDHLVQFWIMSVQNNPRLSWSLDFTPLATDKNNSSKKWRVSKSKFLNSEKKYINCISKWLDLCWLWLDLINLIDFMSFGSYLFSNLLILWDFGISWMLSEYYFST